MRKLATLLFAMVAAPLLIAQSATPGIITVSPQQCVWRAGTIPPGLLAPSTTIRLAAVFAMETPARSAAHVGALPPDLAPLVGLRNPQSR